MKKYKLKKKATDEDVRYVGIMIDDDLIQLPHGQIVRFKDLSKIIRYSRIEDTED